jgi:hypothetical protein
MIYVFCKIPVKGGKKCRIEYGDRVRHSSAIELNMTGYAFENVLIKAGVTQVWGDFAGRCRRTSAE